MQGVFFNLSRPVPLAMFLLSELFAWADAGLDERNLPHVGRSAWHHDHHSSELVSGLLTPQAYDG